VHVTLTVPFPLIGGAVDVICPRPKSKTCTLIWQSTGRAGHCAGGLALCCAHAERGSNAQHTTSTKRIIGM
jgi:hypothetical protein